MLQLCSSKVTMPYTAITEEKKKKERKNQQTNPRNMAQNNTKEGYPNPLAVSSAFCRDNSCKNHHDK